MFNIGYGAVSEEEWLRLSLRGEQPSGGHVSGLVSHLHRPLMAHGLEHCGRGALLLSGGYGSIYSARVGEGNENVQGAGRQIAEQDQS